MTRQHVPASEEFGETLNPIPALTEDEYLAEVLRSAPSLGTLAQLQRDGLLLGALGLAGEAGEVADLIKQRCVSGPRKEARRMAITTIEWTERRRPDGRRIRGYTFNPWWGCSKVSQECTHCYAEAIARHYDQRVWEPATTTPRRLFGEQHWRDPLGWNAQAARDGHRHSVFCASMADVFEDHPRLAPEREKLWWLIEATPWLNWLLLTKRPEHIARLSPWGRGPWPDNVWLGTSVGLQRYAAPRLNALLSIECGVHFVSCEPLLESLDLVPWLSRLQWVICGGESGLPGRVLCGSSVTPQVCPSSSSGGAGTPTARAGACWMGVPGTSCPRKCPHCMQVRLLSQSKELARKPREKETPREEEYRLHLPA